MNLSNHKADFNIEAEWYFFATSHGKGAWDGLGGTIKRHTYRTELQKADDKKRILNAKVLYDWAKEFFENIGFAYFTKDQHVSHH